MMKSTRSLVAAGAVVVAMLWYLSSTAKKAPFIPADKIHRILATQEACIACHAEGKQAPLKADHPLKEQCLVCHKLRKD